MRPPASYTSAFTVDSRRLVVVVVVLTKPELLGKQQHHLALDSLRFLELVFRIREQLKFLLPVRFVKCALQLGQGLLV